MGEVCDVPHRYISTVRDRMYKKEITLDDFKELIFIMKQKIIISHLQISKNSGPHKPVTSSLRSFAILHSLPVLMTPV